MSIRERVAPSRVPSRVRGTLLAYLALTKPRVIELLLVTTIPAMLLADRGTVDPLLILNTLIGGMLAAGGRQHAELRGRRRHRQGDEAHRAAAAGARGGADPQRAGVRAGAVGRLVLLAVVDDQPAVRAAGRRHHRVLRVRLHAAAQAPHVAERGVGRCGGLHAGDDRLVGGHRHHRLAGAGDVRDHLLLDAAAHLGAGDAVQGRLQRGRRADAAGRGDRAPGHQADPDLHLADRAGDAGAGAGDGLAVRGGGAAGRRLVPDDGPPAVRRRASGEPVKPLRLFLQSNNYLAVVFCALAVDSAIALPTLF